MNIEKFEKKLEYFLSKVNRETDLDWIDIVNILGLDCSADHARKTAYGIKEYHEYIQAKGKDIGAEEIYSKLLKKEIDIKKQLSQLSDIRNLVNKETREQQRYESLLDLLKKNIERLNDSDAFYKQEKLINTKDPMKEMIISLSDLHYGLEVHNEWNDYDSTIALNRMNYMIDKSINFGKSNNIQIVHLIVNGDLVNGNIHLTSRLSNRETIAEQVTGVSNLLSYAIKKLSNDFQYVMIHLNSGNHDRICPSKRDNDYDDSYINFIKDYIKIKTENLENVIFDENKYGHDISVFNCCGKKIVATHGDKISSKQLIPRLTTMFGKVDYVFRGHVHNDNLESFGNGKVITTASFSGMDRYAQELGLNSRPEQKIIILEKDSNDELIYNIDLSKIR